MRGDGAKLVPERIIDLQSARQAFRAAVVAATLRAVISETEDVHAKLLHRST
jgi:hypothetical protein